MIRPEIDLRDVVRKWHRAPEQFDALLGAAVAMSAHDGVAIMAGLTPEGADRHLKLGWMATGANVVTNSYVEASIRNAVPYAYYVDQGRGPGKMPPYDAIERWVHAKLGAASTGVEREAGHVRNERKPRTERKPRAARTSRASASGVAGSGERGPISRESLIYLIRRKIAQQGTFVPKRQPPKMIENGSKKIRPVAQRHIYAALAELESRLSSV